MKAEDFRTPTWRRLSQVLNSRIQDLREMNDSPSFGPDKTAQIRGAISELKKILALADEASAGQAVDPVELSSVGVPVSDDQ